MSDFNRSRQTLYSLLTLLFLVGLLLGGREDCLKSLIKPSCVATNNNTRLASGSLRRKNKLEGVVQKRIARIIVITYGLSRLKTLSAALHSRKVLRLHKLYRRSEMMVLVSDLTILGRLMTEQAYRSWSDRALIQVHGSSMGRKHTWFLLLSNSFCQLPTCQPSFPFAVHSHLSVLFGLSKHPFVYG